MDRKNLEYIKTYTPEQFMHEKLVKKIDIKKAPETGKLFFTFGAETGAVSSKGIPEHPMISYVKGEPTEKNPSGEFYLMHEESQGGAEVIATFSM